MHRIKRLLIAAGVGTAFAIGEADAVFGDAGAVPDVARFSVSGAATQLERTHPTTPGTSAFDPVFLSTTGRTDGSLNWNLSLAAASSRTLSQRGGLAAKRLVAPYCHRYR